MRIKIKQNVGGSVCIARAQESHDRLCVKWEILLFCDLWCYILFCWSMKAWTTAATVQWSVS